jgi:muramoyltetrapeptide carboxypeptidase
VWAPASQAAEEAVARGVRVLQEAGFRVQLASNLQAKKGYLAGDDRARLAGLWELLEAGAKAFWAVRGGYGVMRLLPQLPWEALAKRPAWFVGYSDLTALHAAFLTRFPWATLHGPMVASLGVNRGATHRVLKLIRGQVPPVLFWFGPQAVLRPGKASGLLVGGNLSLLAALVGTPYEPPWEGVILALEDVGEPGYRLDRLLTQLSLAGRLSSVAGVVVGQLARCGRGELEFKQTLAQRLLEVVPENCPVVFGLPFGHGLRNMAFPIGVSVTLDCHQGTLRLEERSA